MYSNNETPAEDNTAMDESEKVVAILYDHPVGTVIELAEYIDVEWEKMCIFYEGESAEEVNRTLGFSWQNNDDNRIFNKQYLVFVANKKVTLHFPLPVQLFYLNLGDEKCITKDAATLKIEGFTTENGEELRYFVRP